MIERIREVFISGQPLSVEEISKFKITHALELDVAGEGLT